MTVAEELTEDALVFATVLNYHGAATIPDEMADAAVAAAECIGRRIVRWEGDFDYTRAVFDHPVTEDEADDLLEKLTAQGLLSP